MKSVLAAAVVGLFAVFFAAPAAAQPMQIDLEQFGVGSTYRPNEWVGIRLAVTANQLTEPTAARMQWEMVNADGDIAHIQRTVTLNPGQPTHTWLYGRLLASVQNNTSWTVRVIELRDGRPRGELGVTRISPATALAPAQRVGLETGMIGIIGTQRPGLGGFTVTRAGTNVPVGAHEATRIVFGIAPGVDRSRAEIATLPDRWEGIAPFEVLVWTNAAPQDLQADAADALKEYIRRGGHLVIVLPQASDMWGFAREVPNHLLAELLPSVAPEKVESVPLTMLTQVLSKWDQLNTEDKTMPVHFFEPANLDNHYEPLLALPLPEQRWNEATGRPTRKPDEPGGRVLAIQRLYGHGRITILGVDVSSRDLQVQQAHGGLPQTDALWNRILGRRAVTPTGQELNALRDLKREYKGTQYASRLGSGSLIKDRIGMSSNAAIGLLMALGLFAVYWIVAGPGGFYFLKHYQQVKHTWLAFVATGALFTAVAWGAVELVRDTDIAAQHVTVLDYIYHLPGDRNREQPQLYRASTWGTFYLPDYGKMRISIEPGETEQRNLIASWAAPPTAKPQRYPNVDTYDVPIDSPADLQMPSRATATELKMRWLGALDEQGWGEPPQVDPESPVKQTIRPVSNRMMVSGRLVHNLPGELRDVRIIHVGPYRTSLPRYVQGEPPIVAFPRAPMLNYGRFAIKSTWLPGEPLDLGEALYQNTPQVRSATAGEYALDDNFRKTYYDAVLKDISGAMGSIDTTVVRNEIERRRYIDMLSFFHQLQPPEYIGTASENLTDSEWALYRRHLGRELDLSAWFTRPCVIIIGYLEESSCPVPIRVDGEPVETSGLTVVRWICPLPLEEDFNDDSYDLLIPRKREAPAAAQNE